MSKQKVLVIDDEDKILQLVRSYLERDGFQVETANDGQKGLEAARSFQPDVIVLDIMLPGMDGLEVLSRIRRDSPVYVIMLTAKTEETDKIVGLSVGADDYMTKPFSPRELTARVKAAMRRMYLSDPKQSTNSLTFKDLEIDLASRKVLVEGYEVELTAMEFDLLAAMAEYPGMVLSREQLLEIVWGQDYYGELRVVDVHIGHIRHKLGDYRFISTVRGVGYRFEGEEEEDSGDS